MPTLEQFPEESQRERPGSGTYSTGHASYPRVALLYPSLRSFLYDNPTLRVRRWLIVVILAIGETTAMGVCRTREDAGSGYGQNAGEECYAKKRGGERASAASGQSERVRVQCHPMGLLLVYSRNVETRVSCMKGHYTLVRTTASITRPCFSS